MKSPFEGVVDLVVFFLRPPEGGERCIQGQRGAGFPIFILKGDEP